MLNYNPLNITFQFPNDKRDHDERNHVERNDERNDVNVRFYVSYLDIMFGHATM